MTALRTVLGAVLLSLAGLQIVESIRNGHRLLTLARRADVDSPAVQA